MTNKCIKCEHEWKSRKDNPLCCPRCKRYDWKNPSNQTNEKEEINSNGTNTSE